MPTIKAKLSGESLERAIKQLKDYTQKVKKAPDQIVKAMTKQGVEIAKEEVQLFGAVTSGELLEGIVEEYHGKKGYVHSTAPHSALVEMGSGVIGARNPNGNGTVPGGWQGYDIHNHGDAGWWYPGRDGRRHWTKGMPSRPYMYNTAQMLRRHYADIAREVMHSD